MMIIDDFKADHQDELEEKTKERLLRSVHQETLLMLMEVRLVLMVNPPMKKT